VSQPGQQGSRLASAPRATSGDPQGQDRHRAVAGGGATVLAGQLLGKGLRLLFEFLAAQLLGAAAYGLVVLAVTFSTLAGRLGMLGLDRAVLRFGSQHHGQGDRAAWSDVARFGLGASAVGGALAAAVLLLLTPTLAESFHKPELADALYIVASSVPMISLLGVGAAALQSQQRMRQYALWSFVAASGVSCALLIPSWWLGWGVRGVAVALAAGSLIAGVGALVDSFRRLAPARGAERAPRGPLLRYAATMFIFMGAAQLVHQIDRLMVGALRPAEEVGAYNIAAILASHIPIFLTALNAIVFPKIGAAWHAGQKQEVAELFQLETRWVVTLSAPLFLALSVLREPLMALFGDSFLQGAAAIAVLSGAQLINASAGPVGGVLMMTDRERWVLFNTLLLGGLNAAGNYLLIPHFGMMGAAISTACALACWNLAALAQVWIFHRIQPYNRHFVAPLLCFAAACLVGFGVDAALETAWDPWVATALALLLYAALVWRFGLQPQDKQLKDAILRKLGR
jgi:O-antigen/teichoic acid export membrane protein